MKKIILQIFVLIFFLTLLIQLIDFFNRLSIDTSLGNIYAQTVSASSTITNTDLLEAVTRTGIRIFVATILATIVGGIYGLALFLSKNLRMATSGVNIFVRAIPITFIFGPIGLVTNPFEFLVPAYLAAIPCAFIIADSMASQSVSISFSKESSMKSLLRGRRYDLYLHFYAWEVLNGLLTGIKISVPYVGILVGVLEYIGAGNMKPGFGAILNALSNSGDSNALMIGMVFSYGVLMAVLLSIFYILIDIFVMNKLQK
jgi:ABC-type nitrate/sulfonate/bicarbonate transport system permease component